MRHYHNLLYVSHGTSDETEGLKQALSLARNNEAPLKVLVVCPEFPKEFPDFKKKFEESLLAQVESSLNSTKEAIKLEEDSVDISMELISDKAPAIKIIQYVMQHGHDMVLKEAESYGDNRGFKAIDMELLRKCPCPVWLSHPIKHSRKHIQVAVAIDPENQEPASVALSKRMLELSRSLADSCNGELHIISCWDFPLEDHIRHSVWADISEEKLTQWVLQVKQEHRATLENLIGSAKLSGSYKVHHLRGEADELIPTYVKEKETNILVMGTVARTGIQGFMMGNTAENIIQKLTCSLLALKPQGFVSSVKAY